MAKKSKQADARAKLLVCLLHLYFFDILIEVELFDPKVSISLIIVKARLDSLMCYSRAINY